ncbi:PepSY domain-containing protein [Actimicrobium antarcticum]|uniref:PepSY domain-containing protein n=1 Tax=Actimicrobium antarcticum TaxID=1051899 RepID=A0ABP7T1F2_9BURK
MILYRTLAALAVLSASSAAFADNDCTDPMSEWKPRELLRQEVEQRGWTVQRIKVDDGCYEVRGTDRAGNKIKAKYAPATLRMRSLEVDFGPSGDTSDYLGPVQSRANHREQTGPANKGTLP